MLMWETSCSRPFTIATFSFNVTLNVQTTTCSYGLENRITIVNHTDVAADEDDLPLILFRLLGDTVK